MSLPPAPIPMAMAAAAASVAINPLEHVFMSLNTNPYFIGLMMLLLNLGGRFIGMEVSKEQEKVFQHPIVRKALIFTVIFVATRNIFVALSMTIVVLLLISYLFNENSDLCLWNTGTNEVKNDVPSQQGLTPEEVEIWRRLNEKQARLAATTQAQEREKKSEISVSPEAAYSANMSRLVQ